MRYLFLLVFSCFCFQLSNAQYAIGLVPRQSPDRKIMQKIGYLEVEIKYGSPSVKGRTVWGDLVPYDKVWRAGANEATVIRFSEPVDIAGEKLEAGTYSFFLLPKENAPWEIVFNREAKQWGAFDYDVEKDALRIEVNPSAHVFQEELTYNILQKDVSSGSIALGWERLGISIPFSVDYLGLFVQKIENQMVEQKEDVVRKAVIGIQGAEHLVAQGQKLPLARSWLSEAKAALSAFEGEWNKRYYPKAYVLGHSDWVLARLEAGQGNYELANKLVKELRSNGVKGSYYGRRQERIEDEVSTWKKE